MVSLNRCVEANKPEWAAIDDCSDIPMFIIDETITIGKYFKQRLTLIMISGK
jgi:hypothetical protein